MKSKYIFFPAFLFLLGLASCNKDELETTIVTTENYISYKVDNVPVIVYEDNRLNKEDTTSTFSFSFGTIVHTGRTDTIYSLNGCLNRKSISISFPQVDHPQKFDIYSSNIETNDASGFYQNIVKQMGIEGLMVFHTKNYTNDNILTEKVGEISIVSANTATNEFSGTFYFQAIGFVYQNNMLAKTSNSVNITQGSFHYHWVKK